MTKCAQNTTPKTLPRSKRLASFVARQADRRSPENARRLNASALALMAAAPADPAASNIVWLVANTAPGREFAAQADIADAGFAAYVPAKTVWRSKKGKRVPVIVPLVSRMLFVGATLPADGVFEKIGADVARSADDRPGALLRVPGHVLREYVSRVGVDPVVAIREHPRFAFRGGQRVDVTAGPLAGMTGDVIEMRGDRVRVRVAMFGSVTDAEFGVNALRECA